MRSLIALAVLTLLATSCVKAPPVQYPDVELDIPEEWTAAAADEETVRDRWWSDFGDPRLDSAVEKVLEQNFDLRAASARLDQAAARARIAGADLQPNVGVSFDAVRRKQNFIGFPLPGREDGVLSTNSTNLGVSLDVSWEIDLWGRLSSRAGAAVGDFQASAADLQAARLSLAGQAIKAWFAIAEAQQQLELTRQTVDSWRNATEQVRERFEQGIRPALDLRLSLANLAGAEALLEQRRLQLDRAVRQLEVLFGDYPDKSIEVPSALPDTPPPVPAGLPAEIVARRPDLVSTERRLASADLRVKAARRDLYPRLSLTAAGGAASRALGDLLDGDFSVWSLVGNLVQPIFQGGRLRAAVQQAEGVEQEALANYASAAIRAFGEVETALAAESLLAGRERALSQASEQSRQAEQLAEDRYRSGLESFITVLESQRRALQADSELIAARRLRLENRVDLHLALGGGFDPLQPYYERTEQSQPITIATEESSR